MRSLLILCALSLFVLTLGDTDVHPRGCIYVSGKCSHECEEGTHAYAVNCGNKTPEATCDEPHPVHEESSICDFSACYCDPPTVRDTVSNKCVKKEDCPKKH